MPSYSSLLSYNDAAAVVRQCAESLRSALKRKTETLPLLDALGRVLAHPVVADRDQPPFRRATRDGFACRSGDLPGPLRVVGSLRAGDPNALSAPAVGEHEAVEIMTGAPVPHGADCIVMVEHVTHDPALRSVLVDADRVLSPGENIVPQGTEALAGSVILAAGTRIAASHIGAAAACGYAKLDVYARPRVTVLATGDELVELESTMLPFQIRNSNSYSLSAQIVAAGGEPLRLPVAPDDPGSIVAALGREIDSDLLLLSGGVSAGRYDFVEEALLSLGAEFLFTGVRMQPGRPVVFGRIPGGSYFFGLPGNPVSTLVTFSLFVRPLLDALTGADPTTPRFVEARLAAEVKVKPGLTRFLPAALSTGSMSLFGAEVTIVPWQGSGDLAATCQANCYLVLPPERERFKAGETVAVLLD